MMPLSPDIHLPADADPKIIAVAGYWASHRPAPDLLPARHHLNPIDLGDMHQDLLRHIWLLDVEREPFRFRLRLVGSALRAAGGPGSPGGYVDEFDASGMLTAKLITMCQDRQPLYRRGAPVLPHDPFAKSLENVILPLAEDGVTVDMILGCTVYHWAAGADRGNEAMVLR